MGDYERLHSQVHDCGECLKTFLQTAVEAQPELEDHADVIRDHLEALRHELGLLAKRIVTSNS